MLITVITINYNNLEGLKKTMTSVFEQSYSAIEYIIIDGGSTDGSKAHVGSCQNQIKYWVSEKDKGIYHAMNKGIDQATGEYLLFLNSGDWLVDNVVIKNFVNFKPVEDIVYGDHIVKVDNKICRKFMPRQMSITKALTNIINHQSIFFSNRIFENNRYDLKYKILADWVLTNNSIIFNKRSTRYIDMVICQYDLNGISSNLNSRNTERKRYLKENFDPMFLSLLDEYKSLRNQYNSLNNNFSVRMIIKLLQKKRKIIQYFKK